jgi:hypothetical protein
MYPSNYGRKADGVGKFWVAVDGANPEVYHHGPFDTLAEAEAEAAHLMAEDDADVATVGEGEEVCLRLPDADDVIERIELDLYEQCGDTHTDYLNHTKEAKAELTEAVEKVVADWMTKYDLWPTFCKIEQVKTIRAERSVFRDCQACGRGLNAEDRAANTGMCLPCVNQ